MELENLKQVIPYKWRVQSASEKGAVCVAYIDSRDAQDLLDKVCSPENWQSRYHEVKGNLFCEIGIKIGNEWIWKSDCGTESNIEKQKGEASDAFKRAAVMWGIGRFLYNLPVVKIKSKEYKGKWYAEAYDVTEECRKQVPAVLIPELTVDGFAFLWEEGTLDQLKSALKTRSMSDNIRTRIENKIKNLEKK